MRKSMYGNKFELLTSWKAMCLWIVVGLRIQKDVCILLLILQGEDAETAEWL